MEACPGHPTARLAASPPHLLGAIAALALPGVTIPSVSRQQRVSPGEQNRPWAPRSGETWRLVMLCSLHGRPHPMTLGVIRVLLRNGFLWQSNVFAGKSLATLRSVGSDGSFARTEIQVLVSGLSGALSLGAGKAIFKMVSPPFNGASAPCWKVWRRLPPSRLGQRVCKSGRQRKGRRKTHERMRCVGNCLSGFHKLPDFLADPFLVDSPKLPSHPSLSTPTQPFPVSYDHRANETIPNVYWTPA